MTLDNCNPEVEVYTRLATHLPWCVACRGQTQSSRRALSIMVHISACTNGTYNYTAKRKKCCACEVLGCLDQEFLNWQNLYSDGH